MPTRHQQYIDLFVATGCGTQLLEIQRDLIERVRDVLISLKSQLRLEIFLRQPGRHDNGLDDDIGARYRRNRPVRAGFGAAQKLFKKGAYGFGVTGRVVRKGVTWKRRNGVTVYAVALIITA